MRKSLFLLSAVLCLCCACQQEEARYRVPRFRHQVEVNIVRYDRELFSEATIADSAFWSLYCEDIMQFGPVGKRETQCFTEMFLQDSDIILSYHAAQKIFDDTKDLERDLSEAFFRLRHFVPDIPIPVVSMHLSGFGQSIVSAPGMLSASIDKYLGADYPIYQELFYDYQRARMEPAQLPTDYLNGWLRSEFTHESLMYDNRLLDYMIYEGKLLFLLEKIFPKAPFERLAAWSRQDYHWCKENESRMWERIQYYEHLYSSDPIVLQKYIGEAPNTVYFTEEAPARAAIWLGYRIVSEYMRQQPEQDLLHMMMEIDSDKMLQLSLFRP